MNNPPNIVVDAFGVKVDEQLVSGILFDVKAALALPELNFQYGHIRELNQKLQQWSSTNAFSVKKYPLVWLKQPFTMRRGKSASHYATITDLEIFIIQGSQEQLTAEQRMENIFKPIIYPIYSEILKQIDLSDVFLTSGIELIEHNFVDRYYWGEEDLAVLNDVVDCSIVSFSNLIINNKLNCSNFKSF